MKAKRFAQGKIIAALKAEAGAKTNDLCPNHGISDATRSSVRFSGGQSGIQRSSRVFQVPHNLMATQPHGLAEILAWILRDPVLLRRDSRNGRPRPGVYGINDLLEPVVRWQRFEAATNHEVRSSNLFGRAISPSPASPLQSGA